MSFLDDLIDPSLAYRHVEQNSLEWDTVRAGKFTSSQMYRLMGNAYRPMTDDELKARPKSGKGSSVKRSVDDSKLSSEAEKYVLEKVAEVLTGVVKQQSYAYPIVYGKDMEPQAIEYFIGNTGLKYESVGFICFGDHAGGSPDGLIGDDAILEVKCPWAIDTQIGYLMLNDQYDVKRMYPEYYWQMQSNMLFTQRSLCHFVTYDPRYEKEAHKMVHIEITSSAEDQDIVANKIAAAVKMKLEYLTLLK